MRLKNFKGFHPVREFQYHLFNFKRKLFGEYYWVGPETEIGVCDDCASKNKVGYEKQLKVPVRRLIEEDNLYLCKSHWEQIRNNPDPEIRMNVPPFIRVAKK